MGMIVSSDLALYPVFCIEALVVVILVALHKLLSCICYQLFSSRDWSGLQQFSVSPLLVSAPQSIPFMPKTHNLTGSNEWKSIYRHKLALNILDLPRDYHLCCNGNLGRLKRYLPTMSDSGTLWASLHGLMVGLDVKFDAGHHIRTGDAIQQYCCDSYYHYL